MAKENIRTDMAAEAHDLLRKSKRLQGEDEGILNETRNASGYTISTVVINSEKGSKALGKPRGKYVTMELGRLIHRDDDAFSDAVQVLSSELRSFLNLQKEDSVLLAGLGNESITPDAIGPLTVKNTVITRHLPDSLPEMFSDIRKVAAVETGVLGTTGIESAEVIRAVTQAIRPSCVIAVDALCSASLSHLCTTVQITDAGIIPGSGVGNARNAVNREFLGVPVIAVGVPTVAEASSFAQDGSQEAQKAGEMIVTPRDIDRQAAAISKLLGYAVSMALLDGVTAEDITMLLE